MAEPALAPLTDRRHIEANLLEEVRRTQKDWIEAPADERESARARFMMALHAFNRLVLYDRAPETFNTLRSLLH